MPKLFIGTSGYTYSHWENGVFYPINWPRSKKLEYYCQHFNTTEINSTFYRLPNEKVFKNWHQRVPKNFVFSVKIPKIITHIKKLKDCKSILKTFLKRVLFLKEKLGPLLVQLSPSFKKDIKTLKNFIRTIKDQTSPSLKLAFEFRNESWCDQEVYRILKNENCAWVIADSPFWPKIFQVTADFVYIRMHGSKVLFGSEYTKEELEGLAKKIKKWQKQNLEVYCYFNNDSKGYAVKNAKELIKIIGQR